jgi:hypothetical protein
MQPCSACAATTRSQQKLTHFMHFPWLLVEATLPIFNVNIFIKKHFFEKELMNAKEIAINASS